MFAFSVAARFLRASKAQTLLITLGIAVGVSVQIFIGSLISGLQNDLVDTTIGRSSHVSVAANERNALIEDDAELYDLLREVDTRITVVSPVLESPITFNLASQIEPGFIRGFDFDEANKMYRFDESLVEGRLPEDGEVMVGKELANITDVSIGDTLTFFIGQNEHSLEVVGIVDLGVKQLNETWTVATLKTVQTVMDEQKITRVEMQTNRVFETPEIKELVESVVTDLSVIEWQEENQELLSGLNGQSVSSTMIQLFVIVSVVLGIASVLAISVLQKSKQLGILKAMGIKDRQASAIFLYQGLLLGLIGALIGIVLGLFLLYSFTLFATNPDGTAVVGIVIEPGFIAFSALVAVVASLTASIIPAKRSARLSVIEVIRNG